MADNELAVIQKERGKIKCLMSEIEVERNEIEGILLEMEKRIQRKLPHIYVLFTIVALSSALTAGYMSLLYSVRNFI